MNFLYLIKNSKQNDIHKTLLYHYATIEFAK